MTTQNLTNQPNVNNSSVVLAAQPSDMGAKEMSSLEIAELTGKQHSNVMRDIRTLLDQGVNQINFELVDYIDKKGEKRSMYKLTKKGSLILASGYNAVLREKIIDRWEALETGQAIPMYQPIVTAQPSYTLEEKFKAIELSCKMLRKSKASKARMINHVIVPMGLPAFEYIESEGQFLSAKDLLGMNPIIYKGKKLSVIAFNKIMIEAGFMEEAPQPRGKSTLKLLTKKGEKWGKNEDSVEHPNSITAKYNVKTFPELLNELGLK